MRIPSMVAAIRRFGASSSSSKIFLHIFDFVFRQDRYAIIRFLSHKRGVIAGFIDRFERKIFVNGFCFLQTYHICFRCFRANSKVVQAGHLSNLHSKLQFSFNFNFSDSYFFPKKLHRKALNRFIFFRQSQDVFRSKGNNFRQFRCRRNLRFNFLAVTAVVPLPANGSRIRSFSWLKLR